MRLHSMSLYDMSLYNMSLLSDSSTRALLSLSHEPFERLYDMSP